jgi:branched-chain amino acid transport system permease protein
VTLRTQTATAKDGTRRSLYIVASAIAAAAFLPLATADLFYLHIGNLVLLNAIFVMGLGLILSVGQLSLCHAAFAGLGAYISALLALVFKVPPIFGIIFAALAVGCLATILGMIILRLRGVYFVLITFLFGQTFTLIALNWDVVTRGANGLVGIPSISLLGLSFGGRVRFYYFALTVFTAIFLFLWALMRSTYGRAFRAVAENIQLAESSGIDTSRYQVIAFALGSAIAGIGGAMMGHYIRYISPDSFTFNDWITYITMLVVGGRSSLVGAVLGAVFLTPLPELLRNFTSLQHIIYGAILIVVLLFLPGGLASIASVVRDLVDRIRRTR